MELTTHKQEVNNYTNQQAYVMSYTFDDPPRDLKHLPIKVTFISRKLKTIYFYTALKLEPKLQTILKKYHGKVSFEKAPLFEIGLNF